MKEKIKDLIYHLVDSGVISSIDGVIVDQKALDQELEEWWSKEPK